MRKVAILAAGIVAVLPGAAHAQSDPDWARREMERMQAEQERWNAQVERQRAEQERWAAQAERQRAEQERRAAQVERQRPQHDPQPQQDGTLPPQAEPTLSSGDEDAGPIHTGNDLYRACTLSETGRSTPATVRCFLYVGDVAFGRSVVVFEDAGGGSCFPQGVNLEQLKDIVFAYLRDNPGRRHINATNLTVEAIIQAFPACHPVAVRQRQQ